VWDTRLVNQNCALVVAADTPLVSKTRAVPTSTSLATTPEPSTRCRARAILRRPRRSLPRTPGRTLPPTSTAGPRPLALRPGLPCAEDAMTPETRPTLHTEEEG